MRKTHNNNIFMYLMNFGWDGIDLSPKGRIKQLIGENQMNSAIGNVIHRIRQSVVLGLLSWPLSLPAAPAALQMAHELDLNDHKGSTFLQVMEEQSTGVKAHFDGDFVQDYQVAGWAQIKLGLANFDKKVSGSVLRAFAGGETGLKKFIDGLEGESFKPETIVDLVRRDYHGTGNVFAIAHFISMASGAGTLIRIDSENYFYNFGYRSGDLADDVKSGRSYGAGPSHAATDASDIFYLDELEAVLKAGDDTENFYKVFLDILTKADTSGYSNLTKAGQTAETDLVAIYTAELDRHLMVQLNPAQHPWENDLAEATFISVFNASTGLMYKDGALVEAQLRDHWAKSDVSNRSGIGITRKDRRALQVKVSKYLRANYAAEVAVLDGLIGQRTDGDVFRGLMEFLNNDSTQKKVKQGLTKISAAFIKLLMIVRDDADTISGSI
jgi:hypothetical protein